MRGKKSKVYLYIACMIILLIFEGIYFGGFDISSISMESPIEIIMSIGLAAFFIVLAVTVATAALSIVLIIGYSIYRAGTINIEEITKDEYKEALKGVDMTQILIGIAGSIVVSFPLYYLLFLIITRR